MLDRVGGRGYTQGSVSRGSAGCCSRSSCDSCAVGVLAAAAALAAAPFAGVASATDARNQVRQVDRQYLRHGEPVEVHRQHRWWVDATLGVATRHRWNDHVAQRHDYQRDVQTRLRRELTPARRAPARRGPPSMRRGARSPQTRPVRRPSAARRTPKRVSPAPARSRSNQGASSSSSSEQPGDRSSSRAALASRLRRTCTMARGVRPPRVLHAKMHLNRYGAGVSVRAVPITPDTKNWTWVLERPCPDCGFDATTFAREDVAGMIRANAVAWQPVLARAPCRPPAERQHVVAARVRVSRARRLPHLRRPPRR